MSVENLKEYAQRCATEPELRKTTEVLGMQDLEGHMQHARSLGLDWTPSDLAAFQREMVGATEEDLEDLSEKDLADIAGGGVTTTAAVAVGVAVGAGVGIAAGGAAGAAVGGAAGGGGSW